MGDHGGHQGDGGGGLENNHKKYLQILKVVVGTKQKGCNLCVDNKNANRYKKLMDTKTTMIELHILYFGRWG